MSAFFSLEPMTRSERALSLIAQVVSFSVCGFSAWVCTQPQPDAVVFIGTGVTFAMGVGHRVKRKLSPREGADRD